jgi:hypothetical protein
MTAAGGVGPAAWCGSVGAAGYAAGTGKAQAVSRRDIPSSAKQTNRDEGYMLHRRFRFMMQDSSIEAANEEEAIVGINLATTPAGFTRLT